jgi:hypothetical protein
MLFGITNQVGNLNTAVTKKSDAKGTENGWNASYSNFLPSRRLLFLIQMLQVILEIDAIEVHSAARLDK